MQANSNTAALVIFGFRFVKKRTSLQHMSKQTIARTLWQLQGRTHTHILLLVNEALPRSMFVPRHIRNLTLVRLAQSKIYVSRIEVDETENF